MDIKRGSFRLWIALSGLWVLLVGGLSFENIAEPRITARGFYFPKNITPAAAKAELDKRRSKPSSDWGIYDITLPDGFTYQMAGNGSDDAFARLQAGLQTSTYEIKPKVVERFTSEYRALEEAASSGRVQLVEIVGFPEFVVFAANDVGRDELRRQLSEASSIAASLKETLVGQKRLIALKQAFWVATIPPTVLLLIGLVILWIVQGFRGREIDRREM